jgi:hypothetical protein
VVCSSLFRTIRHQTAIYLKTSWILLPDESFPIIVFFFKQLMNNFCYIYPFLLYYCILFSL